MNRRGSPLRPSFVALLVASALGTAGCSQAYRCPDPIGKIIRDDCDAYKTRYESLKVELGFSLAGMHFGVKAGKEKLRDPSELLQVLMLENMALCKDYNACRVPPADYRRRREAADHKFTAVVAIGQQLKGDLDGATKRRLVQKLIDVISERATPRASAPHPSPSKGARRHGFWRRPIAFHPGMFRRATRPFFGSHFMPARPKLPGGVPVLARWWIGHSSGIGKSSHVAVTFLGKTEVDDLVYVTFSDPPRTYEAPVKPDRKKITAQARILVKKILVGKRGTMTIDYKEGATGKRYRIAVIDVDASWWLKRGYLAYNADPISKDPVTHERPWIIFSSKIHRNPRVTMRCAHNGKSLGTLIEGISRYHPFSALKLTTHAIPLPVRIPVKGKGERTTWKRSSPDEKPLKDLLPGEAKGTWRCVVKINARKARVFSFTLRRDGSVIPARKPDDGAWPWWPIATERYPH